MQASCFEYFGNVWSTPSFSSLDPQVFYGVLPDMCVYDVSATYDT